MLDPESQRVTDEEARELWRRAAELHAAAERSRTTRAVVRTGERGLTLEDVSAAAEGAGIGGDYVRLALAERRLPDGDAIRRDRWAARWLRRVVGDADAIEVSRVVRAGPARVLAAFRAIAERPPYGLRLEDGIGEDPLRDGVLIYRRAAQAPSAFDGALELADARVVFVTVRPEGEGGARLRVRVPLFRRGVNLTLGGVSAGMLGAGGSWGGWTLGGALAAALGVASAAALVLPAGVGAVAGGALGLAGFRRLYHGLVRRAESALRGLLGAVAIEAEGSAPGVLRALEQGGAEQGGTEGRTLPRGAEGGE